MTRAEAEKLMNDKIWMTAVNAHNGKNWVEMFEALGMLKLDEPKFAEAKALELFWSERLPANQILNALARVGLKIVEK